MTIYWYVVGCSGLKQRLFAQEYGTQIKRFGLDSAELPAYVELWNAVAPPVRKDAVQL